MSKVLIDREVLERAVSIPTKESLEANQAAIVDRGRAQSDIRELLAQPAEAEDPVQCPASNPAECYAAGTHVVHASLVQTIVRRVDRYHAALSAVTAERDNYKSWYDDAMDASNIAGFSGISAAQVIDYQDKEIMQLRAEVEASRLLLEQCNDVIAEDGGVYIELRAFLAGEMPAADFIALLRHAAMAAKEA